MWQAARMSRNLVVIAVAFAWSPALADISLTRPPALAVSSADGRLSAYSAELPFDIRAGEGDALLTARVAADGVNALPVYGLRLNLADRTTYGRDLKRTVEVGASWSEGATLFRSAMSQKFGFGVLPRANFVNLSMDVSARRPINGVMTTAAGVRSALTVDGQDVGALSVAAGAAGDTTVGVSLMRPFTLPTEVSFSVRQQPNVPDDDRVMLKLVKRRW